MMSNPVPSYSELVREHFERPQRAGRLAGPDVRQGAAGSTERGVWVEFSVRVAEGRIADARFRAYGCPHTIAAASWVTQHLIGQPLAQAAELDPLELGETLDAPAEKLGNLLVVEDALRDCLDPAGARRE
jgi:NifU-like protein involved in Fe-S cluster formation